MKYIKYYCTFCTIDTKKYNNILYIYRNYTITPKNCIYLFATIISFFETTLRQKNKHHGQNPWCFVLLIFN